MKIVQSYWSKPYQASCINGGMGGWTHKMFHYMSCALSCLKLSEFYPLELVADNEGIDVLINKIGLPYKSVKNDLEGIDYPTSLWAIGKMIAYLSQEEPFLHIDNDIYIWQKFPDKVLKGNIVVQSIEEGYQHNGLYTMDVVGKFKDIPQYILNTISAAHVINSINAGIIGGNNVSFMNEYANEAIRFVKSNLNNILKLENPEGFNLIFEQCLLYNMAEQRNEDIVCLIDKRMTLEYRELVRFWNVPLSESFIHTISSYKRHFAIGREVAQRLWFEYPDYFYRIQKLVKENII